MAVKSTMSVGGRFFVVKLYICRFRRYLVWGTYVCVCGCVGVGILHTYKCLISALWVAIRKALVYGCRTLGGCRGR